MPEEIIILNTGNDDIELKEIVAGGGNLTHTITAGNTYPLPIAFSANPSQIKEWDLALDNSGACEFHQGYLLAAGAAPIAGNKGTLLLSVSMIRGTLLSRLPAKPCSTGATLRGSLFRV